MYKVNFFGRLGTDAETVTTGSTPFISCRVAVDDTIGKERSTRWVNVTADATRYKNLAQYLKKGKLVYVTGNERVTPYLSKSGEPGIDTRIWADSIEFVSSGSKQDNDSAKDDKSAELTTGKLKEKDVITKSESKKEVDISINDDDELPF